MSHLAKSTIETALELKMAVLFVSVVVGTLYVIRAFFLNRRSRVSHMSSFHVVTPNLSMALAVERYTYSRRALAHQIGAFPHECS